MQSYNFAKDLLSDGQSAIVVYTEGGQFVDNHDGTGTTGWWEVEPGCEVNRVILYRRGAGGKSDNDIYTAKFDGLEGPREDGKFSIRLAELAFAGRSQSNWWVFAETQANPVRYVSKLQSLTKL
jgi:hypothetical protein